MKAIIPAAGLGTRFLPGTKCTPKEMLPVLDKPVIQYVVEEALDPEEVDDAIIVTSPGKPELLSYFQPDRSLENLLRAPCVRRTAADQIAIPKHLTAGTICRYKAETILQQVNANYCSNGAILLPNGRAPDATQITEHGSLSNRCRGTEKQKDGARNANPVCKEIWRKSLIT